MNFIFSKEIKSENREEAAANIHDQSLKAVDAELKKMFLSAENQPSIRLLITINMEAKTKFLFWSVQAKMRTIFGVSGRTSSGQRTKTILERPESRIGARITPWRNYWPNTATTAWTDTRVETIQEFGLSRDGADGYSDRDVSNPNSRTRCTACSTNFKCAPRGADGE